jgi:hypothetical protein
MTKFDNEDDPGFIAVAGELRRWSLNVLNNAAVPGRALLQQQQQQQQEQMGKQQGPWGR